MDPVTSILTSLSAGLAKTAGAAILKPVCGDHFLYKQANEVELSQVSILKVMTGP